MTKHIEEIATNFFKEQNSIWEVNDIPHAKTAERKLLLEALTSYGNKCREEERERCIEVVKKSRTLWEGLGVGKNQEDARTQAIIDLQTLNNKTDV